MSTYKVLVIDDEPNILRIMEFELKKGGYEVFTAENGEEALAVAQAKRPDLIISDIMMPKMDGYELCRRVKSDPEMRGIPFIFLTAKTGLENRVQGYALGAEKYITKPCSRQELLKTIDVRLKNSEITRKLLADKAKKFTGDLAIISIFSLLDMFFIGGWSGIIELVNQDAVTGRIDIRNATIEKCTLDGRSDQDTLARLLSWNQGTFTAERE